MKTQDLIGRSINTIWVWSKMETGGFDEASVFIELDNGKIVFIPCHSDADDIEAIPKQGAVNIFSVSKNQKGKFDTLKNQKIIDFLLVEDMDSCLGFLELENGNILTECSIAPHGLAAVGLVCYQHRTLFEERWGQNYVRLQK